MAPVYRILLEGLSTFETYVNRYCQSIFKLPGCRIDIVMDRYDALSTKDQKRTVRAEQLKKGHKRTLVNEIVPKAISHDVGLPQGDLLKIFLTVDENKSPLQQMIGGAHIFQV